MKQSTDKIQLLMKILFIIAILFTYNNIAAAELLQIAVIKTPPNLNETLFHGSNIRVTARKIWNGNMLFQILFGGMGSKGTFVIHPSGITTEIIPSQVTGEQKSQIIGTIIENNILKVIKETTSISITSEDSGELQLKTFSTNGYQSVKKQSITTDIQRFKQSADKLELIETKTLYSSKFVLSRHKVNGDVVSQQTFEGKYADSTIPDFPDDAENGYSLQLKDGLIYVFKLVNTNNQGNSGGLSIKITGSKPDSIVGKIESPNLSDVRVQSSVNIIDWIDIQKIPNPNGKEIVIPFSKEKEFIRIIE